MSGEADARQPEHLVTLLTGSSPTDGEELYASPAVIPDIGDKSEGIPGSSRSSSALIISNTIESRVSEREDEMTALPTDGVASNLARAVASSSSADPFLSLLDVYKPHGILKSSAPDDIAAQSLVTATTEPAVPFSESVAPLLDLSEPDPTPIDPPVFNKQFPFLQLPSEISNQIYELLLTNQRDLSDRVIHGNDLQRRAERRSGIQNQIPAHNSGQSKKSKALARQHLFLNSTAATLSRLVQPVSEPILQTPLLETSILRICRQTRYEGIHILYTLNTFAIMVVDPVFGSGSKYNWAESRPSYFVDALPGGIDISRIRQLRIELQLSGPGDYNPNIELTFLNPIGFRPCTWVPFRMMREMKSLQIFVTFRGDRKGSQSPQSIGKANESKELFERCWRILPAYTNTMRDLVAAIPKHVEKVTWGLIKEQKIKGDYGGHAYVKGCVLRKMYSTFKGLRGTAVRDTITRPGLHQPNIVSMRVDGDGNDSDEDEE